MSAPPGEAGSAGHFRGLAWWHPRSCPGPDSGRRVCCAASLQRVSAVQAPVKFISWPLWQVSEQPDLMHETPSLHTVMHLRGFARRHSLVCSAPDHGLVLAVLPAYRGNAQCRLHSSSSAGPSGRYRSVGTDASHIDSVRPGFMYMLSCKVCGPYYR